MILRTQKLVRDLERIMPTLPGPIVFTVTVLQVVAVACEVAEAIHDGVKGRDWRW